MGIKLELHQESNLTNAYLGPPSPLVMVVLSVTIYQHNKTVLLFETAFSVQAPESVMRKTTDIVEGRNVV